MIIIIYTVYFIRNYKSKQYLLQPPAPNHPTTGERVRARRNWARMKPP